MKIYGEYNAHQLAHELAILNFRLRLGQFCVECDVGVVRGTQRRFPPKCIENNFYAIQSIFTPLEMLSKGRYNIRICSVILGDLSLFEITRASVSYFAENFRCNLAHYESEKCFNSSLQNFFESENFRFLFSFEK